MGVPFPEGYVNILNQIAADGKVQLVSASWGNPEQNFSKDEIFAFDQAIEYMAAEGITFAAATGDCGAYDAGQYKDLAIDIPSADPYTLAVGGTQLQTDAKGTRGARVSGETCMRSASEIVPASTCRITSIRIGTLIVLAVAVRASASTAITSPEPRLRA